ncbi:MAG: NAD kinase [Bacteroidales bacterium]|nr:NAD kinase [Bacteroidales bacterium]
MRGDSVILFGRIVADKNAELYDNMLQYLRQKECKVKVVASLYDQLFAAGMRYTDVMTRLDTTPAAEEALAMLSVGGDGTFLESARMMMGSGVPILGVNSGRLGFLSDVAQEKVKDAIDDLLSGNYRLGSHDVISLYANNDREPVDYALNEFAVSKCDNSSMLTIHAYVDGEYLSTYWADGLIVATATGSTAYSLSVGGPIVYPSTPDLIITPIAPHNLNVRPLIIPSSSVIQLRIEGRGPNILTSLDGRNHVMENNCQLRIAKAPFDVKVVQLRGHSFFATLRGKLMWGADMRNN